MQMKLKRELLGVPEEIIEKHGAVSEEVVSEHGSRREESFLALILLLQLQE